MHLERAAELDPRFDIQDGAQCRIKAAQVSAIGYEKSQRDLWDLVTN